ncbi:zinc finger protein 385C-like [Anoplopoma fimbria]|uniref:zinc finger protein 385C-like n=1 Tax=Anoplopoma fimbria TaxID=229290 RepID=UPI0023EDD476|nr:zinc finger protein 385C-like [Anoplopoma fimbria]
MKQPKSPDWPDSSHPPKGQEGEEEDVEEEDEEERKVAAAVHRVKRERRQGSSSTATMCRVCNIQLNSNAQAQIHYRGKTHQRRLRRLAKAVSTGTLSQSQVHPLLGSLPLPGRPLQPQTHAQLEHFLPLRINSSSPLNLFHNFSTMDPVQKAVINHTFGVAPVAKKKPIISCNICHLRFNSTTQAEAHYKGHKHARKLKALETQRNRQKNGHSPTTTGKDRGRERGMMGGRSVPIDSHLKDVTGLCTSSKPAQQQPENTQESLMAPTTPSQPSPTDSSSLRSPQLSHEISPGSQLNDLPSDSPPVEGCSLATGSSPHSGPQGSNTGGEEMVKLEEAKEAKGDKKPLHCPTCKVTVNSSSQWEAHCSGSRHKQMLDGHHSSQSQRRVKMTSSPRPTSRIKQRMGNKTRAVVGVSSQPFHCELCQVSVNSETQLKQHMNSRRHKERLAGKPVKAKFTPYNKLQSSAMLATKLALQKQLSKALPAGFLTNPLNPAALCSMASGPLGLRLPPGPTAIIHGPLISPTLFRPAPGPLRATHAPIIFSPY